MLLRTLVSVVAGLVACTSNHALAQPVEASYNFEFFFDPLFEEAVGSTLVFTKLSEEQGQNEFAVAEIYSMSPDGSNQLRITTNATFDLMAEPSPDGMTVAFHRAFGAACPCQIQLVDIDGSNERTLATGTNPSWSPNGQQLTFNAPGVEGRGDIWVINADGTGLTNVTQTPWGDSFPDFSPNGQKIAYTSSRTGNPEIWVMSSDGTNPVQVTNHPAPDVGADWSPNGQRILFQSMRDDPRGDIYVVDHQGVHRLTTSTGRDLDANWSPTGQRIVFDSDRNYIDQQMRQVFIMNADGSDQHPITFFPHEDSHASWTHGNINGH